MIPLLIGAVMGLIIVIIFLPAEIRPSKKVWKICQNANGRYSFTKWNGNVDSLDYGTYEEAVGAMEETRRWSDAYDNRDAIQKNRNAQFKPIE